MRDTDGERFVALNKGRDFRGISLHRKKENGDEEVLQTIKILLYVIIYPLATELFALQKTAVRGTDQNEFAHC